MMHSQDGIRGDNSTIVRAGAAATFIALRTLERVSPTAAAALLEKLLLTPPRSELTFEEESFLATGAFQRVVGAHGELAVWSWGEGRTVLLVHGWGSLAGRLRSLTRALVEAGFRVVAFDLPGHGRSSGRRSSLPETQRAVRLLARRERERRGEFPFAVVAHSLGSAASVLAQDSVVHFRKNVFIAPAIDLDGHLKRAAGALGVGPAIVQRMIRRVERRLGFCWDALDVTRMARRHKAPALILHDPLDVEVPFREVQTFVGAWTGAQLVQTPSLGHRRALHDAAVHRQIVMFLRSGAQSYSAQSSVVTGGRHLIFHGSGSGNARVTNGRSGSRVDLNRES